MKILINLSILILLAISLEAQEQLIIEEGKVSFVTSKNVYVQFEATKNINIGDTLFVDQSGNAVPYLLVENKSSSSTVCKLIGAQKLKKGDVVIARSKIILEIPKAEATDQEEVVLSEDPINNQLVLTPEEEDQNPQEEVLFKEKIKGRISVATYNNLSKFRNLQRMRYAFSFRGYNLKNSKFSVESYITFRHTLNDSINIADALKVYALNVKYEFDKSTNLILGRKINPKFSSMGAIDGLQFEKGFGRLSFGAIAGTRPDFQDYGFNPDLLQFGAYVSLGALNPAKYTQTTLGLVEQMNKGNTDRRFVYFQHSSALTKKLNFFGSMEVDLFEKINNEQRNTTQLTNLYVSLRYRMNRKFRLSLAYDNRKNIIYYESYRNFIDQLIQDETRQGFRVNFSHRITKNISWGGNGSMRFQKSRQNPSRSAGAYVTYNRIPFLNARGTLRVNILQTDFLDSQILGLRLNKELIRNRLSGELYYRWVDYKYKIGDRVLHQDIGGASLSLRIQKQLSLHVFYEGVYDNTNQIYHRINARLIKRF